MTDHHDPNTDNVLMEAVKRGAQSMADLRRRTVYVWLSPLGLVVTMSEPIIGCPVICTAEPSEIVTPN